MQRILQNPPIPHFSVAEDILDYMKRMLTDSSAAREATIAHPLDFGQLAANRLLRGSEETNPLLFELLTVNL